MRRAFRVLAVLAVAATALGCSPKAAVKSPTATPSPTQSLKTPAPAPSGFKLITDTAAGYSMAVPATWMRLSSDDANLLESAWKQLESENPEQATLLQAGYQALKSGAMKVMAVDTNGALEGYAGNLNLLAMPKDSIASPDAYILVVRSQLATAMKIPEADVVGSKTTMSAGPAAVIDYTFQMSAGGQTMQVQGRQYAIFASNNVYVLSCGASPSAWAKYEPIFKTVADSITALN